MAREVLVEYEGAVYHVFNRGDRRDHRSGRRGGRLRDRCASVNAVIKRVKVSPAELAICGGDG